MLGKEEVPCRVRHGSFDIPINFFQGERTSEQSLEICVVVLLCQLPISDSRVIEFPFPSSANFVCLTRVLFKVTFYVMCMRV